MHLRYLKIFETRWISMAGFFLCEGHLKCGGMKHASMECLKFKFIVWYRVVQIGPTSTSMLSASFSNLNKWVLANLAHMLLLSSCKMHTMEMDTTRFGRLSWARMNPGSVGVWLEMLATMVVTTWGVHKKVKYWIIGLRLMATSLYKEIRAWCSLESTYLWWTLNFVGSSRRKSQSTLHL